MFFRFFSTFQISKVTLQTFILQLVISSCIIKLRYFKCINLEKSRPVSSDILNSICCFHTAPFKVLFVSLIRQVNMISCQCFFFIFFFFLLLLHSKSPKTYLFVCSFVFSNNNAWQQKFLFMRRLSCGSSPIHNCKDHLFSHWLLNITSVAIPGNHTNCLHGKVILGKY